MFKKISIRAKIALVFILVITLLMGMSGTVLYLKFSLIFQERIMDDLYQIMIQDKIYIENMITNIDQITFMMYNNDVIKEVVSKPSFTKWETIDSIYKLRNKIAMGFPISTTLPFYNVTLAIDDIFPFAQSLTPSSISLDGSSIVFNNGSIFRGSDVANQTWYKNAIDNNGNIYWFIYKNSFNNISLCASRLIKNPWIINSPDSPWLSADNVGVVLLNVDISQIKNLIDVSKLTPNTELLVTDNVGNIIFSKDNENIGNNIVQYPFSSSISAPQNNEKKIIINNGIKSIFQTVSLNYGWNLTTIVPITDILRNISVIKNIILMVLAVSIILGIILSLLISSSITQPIRKLASIMKEIKETQNINTIAEPASKDEVGILYESYNSMMERMRSLMEDMYLSGLKEKETELKALQAQINPHFLYNTLDSVNWIALELGSKQITEIISSLSTILRYSIKNGNELVTVSEELEQVRKYISIQTICYPDSFEVVYNIDPEVLELKSPKLILQPLVENALLHGSIGLMEKGMINIFCTVKDNSCILAVEDNGIGANVDLLNSCLRGEVDLTQLSSSGYGIKNVDQRIKLHFGCSYGLHFESNKLNGVTALICLPRK